MKTFEQLRRYIKENIPDPFDDTKKGEGPDFEKELKKTKSKGLKTYKQKSLNLYKSGGPFVPEKEVSQTTGKTVKMEKKPYFGKPTLPKRKEKAPDRTGLKRSISDVRASDKKLYDAGVGKKPSLVQQRKYTKERIKQLSRQTTLRDRLYGSTGSTEGTAGASGSPKSKTPTPTKPQTSASATDFTKKINQKNKNRKEFTGNKKTFSAFKKQADSATNKLVSKREVVRSTTDTKDVKKLRDINKQIKASQRISKGYDLASKGKGLPNAPVVASDLKTVTDNTPKVTASTSKPQKGYDLFKADPVADKFRKNIEKSKELKDLTKEMGKKNLIKSITPTGKTSKVVSKKNIALTGKLLKQKNYKYVQAGAKLGTKLGFGKGALVKVGKAVGRLGTGGRIVGGALAIAGAASRPGIRQGFKTFLKGAGLGGLVGAGAQLNKKKPVGDAVLGPKKIKTVSTSLEPPKPKETSYSKTMKSVKPYDFTKIKQDIADKKQKAKADRKADRLARDNALSTSEKQRQRRGVA